MKSCLIFQNALYRFVSLDMEKDGKRKKHNDNSSDEKISAHKNKNRSSLDDQQRCHQQLRSPEIQRERKDNRHKAKNLKSTAGERNPSHVPVSVKVEVDSDDGNDDRLYSKDKQPVASRPKAEDSFGVQTIHRSHQSKLDYRRGGGFGNNYNQDDSCHKKENRDRSADRRSRQNERKGYNQKDDHDDSSEEGVHRSQHRKHEGNVRNRTDSSSSDDEEHYRKKKSSDAPRRREVKNSSDNNDQSCDNRSRKTERRSRDGHDPVERSRKRRASDDEECIDAKKRRHHE